MAKSIGVSNFTSDQIDRISRLARIPIAANQVECNAYFMQKKLRATMDNWGIKIMAYGPLGSPGRSALPGRPTPPQILSDPVVVGIAKSHNKTPAQVQPCFNRNLQFLVVVLNSYFVQGFVASFGSMWNDRYSEIGKTTSSQGKF